MLSKRIARALGLLMAVGLVLAACAPAGGTQVVVQTQVVNKDVVATAAPAPETPVLRINEGSYPDIIDPQKSSFVGEIAHLQMIYEGLTRLDTKLQTVPGAAEKWEYNAEATELTFTLRKDLKYSDGTLLNAKRFEYSILRNIDPATAGEYAQITDDIAGAAEWRGSDGSEAALKDAVQVHALDSAGAACTDYEQADCLTLKIGLAHPAPYFHTVMALWVTYPAKEESITDGGDQWWNSSKYHIGNGPFILKTLEPFVRAHFVPNPNYWGGVAKYDLDYQYVNDSAVAFEAYKNNEFEIVGLAPEDLAGVKADPVLSQEAHITPGSCTIALMFHQLKEPFTDQKVREAFSYALDRQGWVTDVLKDLGAPTLTWIPPGFPGFKEGETRFGFDPEKAKQAIAESSYGSVDKLPPLEMTFADSPRNRTRYEWLAGKYKDALGVSIALNPVESTTYTAMTKDINTAPQFFILGWCADYPDPQNWLSVYWKTGGFGERIGYSNPDFDALVDQADATVDPVKRMDLYAQAQDLLVSGSPVAFMYNTVNNTMIKPWVKGLTETPMDNWPGSMDVLGISIDTAAIPK
jgi:oligopeptide transport system substrate-binding protein